MTIAEKFINEEIEKAKFEIAVELKKLGSNVEFISKATRIPIAKLKELLNEKKDK